jgi:NADH-quinone oxidoreductase subunit N
MNDYTIDGFNGLAKEQPTIAVSATIFLLSLTGIPLTAGFQGKFYMLMSAIRNGHHIWLVIFAVLMAAISAYYYFKIIQAMFFKDIINGNASESLFKEKIKPAYIYLLCFTASLIILIGLFPTLITNWLHY